MKNNLQSESNITSQTSTADSQFSRRCSRQLTPAWPGSRRQACSSPVFSTVHQHPAQLPHPLPTQCRPCCRRLLVRSSSSPALPAVRCITTRLSSPLERKRYRRSGTYKGVRCNTKVKEHRECPYAPTRRYSSG